MEVGQLGHYDLLRARCYDNGPGWLEHMYWPRLVHKGHLMPKLTYHSTTIMLIMHLCFSTFLNAYWYGTYHFRASPVTLGPNPYPDPLSPL